MFGMVPPLRFRLSFPSRNEIDVGVQLRLWLALMVKLRFLERIFQVDEPKKDKAVSLCLVGYQACR